MKKYIVILLLGLFAIIISSCSKDRIEAHEDSLADYEPINDYLDTKKQEEQEFIITEEGNSPIVGNQGTELYVSKDIFMHANGDSVDFPYIVKLIELYTPKDMFYYQMPTVSNSELIRTRGEVRVRAFKDEEELLLRPEHWYITKMPTNLASTDMNVYYGEETDNIVNWVNSDSTFYYSASMYFANIYKLGWINCDRFIDYTGDLANFNFESATDNLENVAIFMYFPTLQSIMQVYNQSSASVPVDESVKIIALGINSSGELWHYYQQRTVSTTNDVDVELEQISDSEFEEILNNL